VVHSQVASYQAELELAQATLKRQQELFEAKAATDQQLDESRAKAKVTAAQVGVAQAKMAAADADLAAAEAAKSVAAAQEKAAAADIERLQTLIQYTRVTAPFDGVVTRRMVSRGDLVQSGASNRATPLFTCQRIDTIRVFCDAPQSSAPAIGVGTNASVKILGLENAPVKATVTRIGYALNASTRTMRVEIDVPNPKEELRPGMYAEVTLTLSNP
jgi:RND family efflux transporter MFP subunit